MMATSKLFAGLSARRTMHSVLARLMLHKQCRCKEHGVTVQAAFSAASMLAMAKAQARNYPLPQNILMQTHVNMRSQVGNQLQRLMLLI